MDAAAEIPYRALAEFEWDDAKAASNLAKHGVPFPYAARVFLDPLRIELDASRATDGEPRLKTVGTIEGRLFSVVFPHRGPVRRLISARRSNAQEARAYGNPLQT